MHLHSKVGSALQTCTLWLEESATTIELSGPTAIPLGQVKHPGPLPRLPILKRSCLFCIYWLLRVVPTSAKPPENFINSGYAYMLDVEITRLSFYVAKFNHILCRLLPLYSMYRLKQCAPVENLLSRLFRFELRVRILMLPLKRLRRMLVHVAIYSVLSARVQ